MATRIYQVRVRVQAGGVDVDPGRVRQFVNTEPGVSRELLRRADRAADYQRRTCPRRTGRLAATVRTQLSRSGGGPAALAITGREGSTPYLGYLLYGTAAHEIRPRTRKALRFASGSGVVFASRVRHPGTRGRNFIVESLAAAGG